MKLCILDRPDKPYFDAADFSALFPSEDFRILQLDADEVFDGSIFRSVPQETVYLVTRFADRLTSTELENLPNLKYIGLAYTGWWDKYFDIPTLKQRGIVVTNNPVYAPNAVAEAHLSALFYIYRGLGNLPLGEANFKAPLGREVRGKTIGVIGLGYIGRQMAKLAQGMGMRVISASSRNVPGVTRVSKGDLLKESDIISLHIPKSAGQVLGPSDFSKMRTRVTILNSSGYENVHTEALKSFLADNELASYAYLAQPTEEYFSEFMSYKNALLFPLYSSKTEESQELRISVTIENLKKFLQNEELQFRVV